MRAAGAADPPAAEVAHAGSSIRLVGRAAAFAAAESCARCRENFYFSIILRLT